MNGFGDIERQFLSEIERQELEREEAQWQALVGSQQAAPAAEPTEMEPNIIQKFLQGVTAGMRGTPNVFRPGEGLEGEVNVLERVGEAGALPFTMGYNAVTQGLVNAGLISPRTQEQLSKSLVGAMPALMAPRQPAAPGAVKQALKGGKRGAVRVPEFVQRFEEPGIPPATTEKPHGIYATPADVESPHTDLGGQRTTYKVNPEAKILTIEETKDPSIVMRRGAVNAGAGVWAARHIIGPEEFSRLKSLNKSELAAEASKRFPNVDWTLYTDRQEILEGLGGMLTREKGFDAIYLESPDRAFSEYVALTDRAMVPGKPPPAEPTPPIPPAAVPPPTGAPGINVARVAGEESVGRTMQAVNAAMAERLAEHRKRVPHEKTIAEAKDKLTVEQALAIPPETWGKLAPEETALRDLSNTASTHLSEVITRANAGDAQALADLTSAYNLAGELTMRDEALGRNIARGLEARKILSEAERAPIGGPELTALRERLQGADVPPAVLLERLNNLRTTAERTTLARQHAEARHLASDIFHELYISGLVSGPRTQASNVLANALLVPWEIGERAIAGIIPSKAADAITLRESAAQIGGLLDGYRDGIRLAGKVLRGEEVQTMKLEGRTPAISAKRFGLEETFVGQAIDGLGAFVRLPFLGLSTADAFFKGLNFRMEVRAQAVREALAEGLRGKALTERSRYIEDHLVEFPTIKAAAENFALAQTLQQDFGWISQKVNALRGLPGGRVLVPFLQVAANSLAWTMERIPGLNLPSTVGGRLASELRVPGPPRQQALAKIVTGAMFSSLIARLVLSGHITGQGPRDKDERSMKFNTGWRPYSVKLGDDYYEYRRLAPIGQMIGVVADFAEIAGQLPEHEALPLATALAIVTGRNALNQTWMRTASDLFDAIEDPERSAQKFAQSLARSMVPTAVREMERQADPELREVRSVLDAARESVPGYSSTLPPRRNVFGESILTPDGWGPDWLSPISTGTDKPDIVAKELDRLKLGLSMPSKIFPVELDIHDPEREMHRIMGEKKYPSDDIELFPDEYDALVRWSGNELKINGKGMKDRLRDLMQTEKYQEWSDERKAIQIYEIVNSYREAARGRMLKENPKLRQLYDEKIRIRKARIRQRTPQPSIGR